MNPRKRSPSDVASTTSSAALSRTSLQRHLQAKDTTVRHVDTSRAPSSSSSHKHDNTSSNSSEPPVRTHAQGRSMHAQGHPHVRSVHDDTTYEGTSTESDSGSGAESSSSDSHRERSKRYGHSSARMTEVDEMDLKQNLLHQFSRLEKRGVTLPRKFTLASSLSEMQIAFDNLKQDRQTDVSVAWQRKMLMVCVTGIEMLNGQFNPFDVKLKGWSDTIHDNVDEYDDIFEELSVKYGGKSTMAPELRLLFGIGGSAVMFHMTQSLCHQMPCLENVLKSNPALMQQVAAAMMQQGKQGSAGSDGSAGSSGMKSFLGNMFGQTGSQPQAQAQAQAQQPPPPISTSMRGPVNVDDMLRDLHESAFKENDSRIEVLSVASDSDISDIASISAFMPPPSSSRVSQVQPPNVKVKQARQPRGRRNPPAQATARVSAGPG